MEEQEQEVLNDLGGNMPQERLDKIKQAWLDRHIKTEADWYAFSPVRSEGKIEVHTEAEREEKEKFQVTASGDWDVEREYRIYKNEDFDGPVLCPTWEVLAYRHAADAHFHLEMARKFGRTPRGIEHFNEALAAKRQVDHALAQHHNVIRKVKGCS